MKKLITILSGLLLFMLFVSLSGCTRENKVTTLTESSWEVLNITSPDRIFILVSPSPYKVNFQEDNKYTMRLDVNSCESTYLTFLTPDKNTIHIDPIACTKICCDKAYADTLLNILRKVDRYKIADDNLELISANRIINLIRVKE